MRTRLSALSILAVFLFALALTGWTVGGFRRDPVAVIGVISHAAVADPSLAGFKAGLTDLGRVEDRQVLYLYDGPTPDPAALAGTARRLVERRVDLILALSTPAAQAALAAARPAGIPVIFAPASDPVGSGLVASLARPGGRATGVTFGAQEARRLEWLTRLVPDARRIWVPYNADDPSPRAAVARLHEPAARLGLDLVLHALAGGADGLTAALAGIPADVDAVFVPPDALVATRTPELVAAATARRLPLTVPHRNGVALGATFSFGFDLFALGQQAARLADQILRGVDPATLPVETAEFRLTINLNAAERLGLALPDTILRQADLVPSSAPGD